jgi:hypothetical protein
MRFFLVMMSILGIGGFIMLNNNPNRTQNESDCPKPRIPYSEFWTLTDFCKTTVPIGEIISGGPPPDGIPPIDNPSFESIELASAWLQPQSPVLVFAHNGIARAYPLAIMTRHEIVNDEIDGLPIAVTYCPLCNSGIVFERRIDDVTIRLGVSGLLRNSDMVMWDDVSQTWWQQFTGEGIVGEYAGEALTMLSSAMVGFGAFIEQYPEGEVLTRESGYGTNRYGSNPYFGYDSTTQPFLFTGELDTRLPATERVLAGVIGGEPIAYPFTVLAVMNVINDGVGGKPVVAFWQSGATSALDDSNIDASRDVGMAMLFNATLDDVTYTFRYENGQILDDQTNSVWNVFGTAIEGELAGAQLRQELAAPHFWFAWAAFKPDTRIYELLQP